MPDTKRPAVYFAWCEPGEPFDPDVHCRRDDDPLQVVVTHSEWNRRVATVRFRYTDGGSLTEDRVTAHISVRVGDVIQHLGYFEITKGVSGLRGEAYEVEFESVADEDSSLQGALLDEVRNDPVLYVPQVQEASDGLDADTILAATTMHMEFAADGTPYLCSIFGDPDRLRVIQPMEITRDDTSSSTKAIPPSEAVGTVVLEWMERKAESFDAGQVIQNEIDRIGAHYGLGPYGANYTITPGFVKDWAKPGTTIGDSFVIEDSFLGIVDGPGTGDTSSVVIEGANGSSTVQTKRADAAGIQADGGEDGKGGTTTEKANVDLEHSGFSSPVLNIYGVRVKRRREIITIVVPNKGQQVRRGNAEPLNVGNFTLSGLSDDETVKEWESETDYNAGMKAKAQGMVWNVRNPHRSNSSLLADRRDNRLDSLSYGLVLWDPATVDNSPLGRPDVTQASLTGFGRRVINHVVRRCVAQLASAVRCITVSAKVPVDQAYDLDTGYTVRLVSSVFKGGFVEGKVSSIGLAFNADNGTSYCSIDLACAIGSGAPGGSDEDGYNPLPVVHQDNVVSYAFTDPQGYYAQAFPAQRPDWWPSERAWPPTKDDDTLGIYTTSSTFRYLKYPPGEGEEYADAISITIERNLRPGGVQLEALESDPYDFQFPAEMPEWWPHATALGFPQDPYYSWPPSREEDPFGLYEVPPRFDEFAYDLSIPWNTDGSVKDGATVPPDDFDGDGSGGSQHPVATYGGAWDLVRYRLPIYVVSDLPEQLVKCKVMWLGCEQSAAVTTGFPVWDPYGGIYLPGNNNPVRPVVFIPGTKVDKWLEEHMTDILLTTPKGDEAEPETRSLFVPVTYGWYGPRQVEL